MLCRSGMADSNMLRGSDCSRACAGQWCNCQCCIFLCCTSAKKWCYVPLPLLCSRPHGRHLLIHTRLAQEIMTKEQSEHWACWHQIQACQAQPMKPSKNKYFLHVMGASSIIFSVPLSVCPSVRPQYTVLSLYPNGFQLKISRRCFSVFAEKPSLHFLKGPPVAFRGSLRLGFPDRLSPAAGTF